MFQTVKQKLNSHSNKFELINLPECRHNISLYIYINKYNITYRYTDKEYFSCSVCIHSRELQTFVIRVPCRKGDKMVHYSIKIFCLNPIVYAVLQVSVCPVFMFSLDPFTGIVAICYPCTLYRRGDKIVHQGIKIFCFNSTIIFICL